MSKTGGSDNDYADGIATSTAPMTAVTAVAPSGSLGQDGNHFYRLCLTTNIEDDQLCANGLYVGMWGDGRIATSGTCVSQYVSTYTGGEVFSVQLDGGNLRVEKDGASIRSCTATVGAVYYAKVFIYKVGGQINVALTPASR